MAVKKKTAKKVYTCKTCGKVASKKGHYQKNYGKKEEVTGIFPDDKTVRPVTLSVFVLQQHSRQDNISAMRVEFI